MKKKLFIVSLILIMLFTLSSCMSASNHVHKWSNYYDNGDGTHYRFCLKDSTHKEYSEHNYGEPITISEATDFKCGKVKYTCQECGYSEIKIVEPNGEHTFDKCIVKDEYLYEDLGNHTKVYYKSCECGAYGNDNYLFEYSDIDNSYTEVSYIRSNGESYIDTGLSYGDYTVSYSYRNSRLPVGYTEVEYIESTGTQYIDTEYLITSENINLFKIEIDQTIKKTDDIWSVSGIGGNNQSTLYVGVRKDGYIGYGSNSTDLSTGILYEDNTRNKYVLDMVNLKYEVSGNQNLSMNVSSSGINGSYDNYLLFAFIRNSTKEIVPHKAKIYSCKMYENDILIRNFIPCINASGEAGLYDLVYNKFYSNSGTGEFECGSTIIYTNDSSLPSEYQEVEYIKGTGTQYIDTGVTVDSSIKIVIDSEASESGKWLFGARSEGGASDTFGLYLQSDDKWYAQIGGSANINGGNIVSSTLERCTNTLSGSSLQLNGTSKSIENSITKNDNITLYLFAMNENGDIDNRIYKGKLYSCLIYKNDILIRNFIPCYKKDGEIGLYDLVTNRFYSNSGTGSFIKGSNIYSNQGNISTSQLPSGYQEVEYIESTGTQYIDTEAYLNLNTDSFEIKCQSTCDTQNGMVMGEWYGNYYYWLYYYGNGLTTNLYLTNDEDTQVKFDTKLSSFDTDAHIFKVYDKKMYVDDSLTSDLSSITFNNGSSSTYLFDVHYSSNPSSYSFKGKIYYCKIYQDGLIIRDFVPCYVIATGEIGLYDKVNNKFYSNSGSGVFLKGPNVYSSTGSNTENNKRYQEYGELVSTGGAYIELDYKPNNNTKIVSSFKTNDINSDKTYFYGSAGLNYNDNAFEAYTWANKIHINFGNVCHQLGSVSNNEVITIAHSSSLVGFETCGNQFAEITSNPSFTCPNNLTIFALNRNNITWTSTADVTFYGMKIYENDELIYDLVPCMDLVSSECGLYDKVNDKFYSNKGDGNLSLNDEKDIIVKDDNIIYYSKEDLPDTYTQLTYIEACGDTYLDTGIKYDSSKEYKVNTSYMYTKLENITQTMGFSFNSSSFGIFNNNIYGSDNNELTKDTYYEVEYVLNSSLSTTSINNYSKTILSSLDNENHNLLLFASYESKDSINVINNCYMKLYRTKIYVDNILVRDYVPAKSNVTGRVGLYDLINDEFIYSDLLKEGNSIEINIDTSKINLLYNDGYCSSTLNRSIITTCYMYDNNGNIVRDFVPVIRNCDSVAGLYDLINHEFYRSSSGIDFIAGPICAHYLNDGVITKNNTYSEDGIIEYTCSICGSKIYDTIDKTSYKCTIISEIEDLTLNVYKSPNMEEYLITTDYMYSINPNSYNYSKTDCIIKFSVNTDIEYEIYSESCTIEKDENNIYTISDINNDFKIYINSKETLGK